MSRWSRAPSIGHDCVCPLSALESACPSTACRRNPSKPSNRSSARCSSTRTRSSRSPTSSGPEDFYRGHHGTIYGAVLDLYERREPVDLVTVSEVLERRGQLDAIGGSAYLTSLINLTPTAVNAVHYARIVERKAVLRNLISAAGRIAGHRLRGGSRRRRGRSTAPSRSSSRSARSASRRASARSSRSSTRPTTGSTTCTSTRARSAASGPGFADLDTLTTGSAEVGPHHRRRPPVDRQDDAGAQLRRARRRPRGPDGRHLQPRDEQGAARPAPAQLGRQHRLAAPAHGLPRGDGLHAAGAGHEQPGRGARSSSTTRPTSRPWSCAPRRDACRPSPAWT